MSHTNVKTYILLQFLYDGLRIEVIYDKGRLTLGKVLCSNNSGVLYDLNNMTYFDEFIGLLTNSKVVGNVYDNPELLEME